MSGARGLSVNVGGVRAIEVGESIVTSGIWKHPVEDRVALRGVNLHGDDEADGTVHGGEFKAPGERPGVSATGSAAGRSVGWITAVPRSQA